MATIDDGAWTATKHTSVILDEDQQPWISDVAQGRRRPARPPQSGK
jgi:hypothetical protein